MNTLTEFSWATVLRDDGAIFAREISSRLPQLEKIDFGIWEPSHIVLFNNLTSLEMYIEPDQVIQLVSLCRDSGKLPKLKSIRSDSAISCSYYYQLAVESLGIVDASFHAGLDPVVWQKIVSPTFLWPRLEKLQLLHHHRRRREGFTDLQGSWSSFCQSHSRTAGTTPLKSLTAPMNLEVLQHIADTFSQSLNRLYIILPKELKRDITQSESLTGNWLEVISRFERLRSIQTSSPFPASDEAVRKYLLPLETLESLKMHLRGAPILCILRLHGSLTVPVVGFS
jgi:hypothetical protein